MQQRLLKIIGQRFGDLTVIRIGERSESGRVVECRCECGQIVVILRGNLRSTRSCGCLRRNRMADLNRQRALHGLSQSSEFRSWASMLERCFNPKNSNYSRYGGRGITVCDRWRVNFKVFYDDMGPKPSPVHTVERKENDGNYEPANCVWATPSEQAANRSTTRRIEYQGDTLTLREWAEKTGIEFKKLQRRANRGLPPERILATTEAHK